VTLLTLGVWLLHDDLRVTWPYHDGSFQPTRLVRVSTKLK
jgi:hypothetical protein